MFLKKFSLTKVIAVSCLAAMLGAMPVKAAINIGEEVTETAMHLSLGKGRILTIPGGVADVMIADPKVADVSAIQSNKLYIVGTSLGNTNIMVLDNGGNLLQNYNVDVSMSASEIQAMVHKIFPQEKDVQVELLGQQLVLTGLVSSPAVSQKIARLVAAQIQEMMPGKQGEQPVNEIIENLMEVRGEQQVMLKVRIVEMSRGVLKELGTEIGSADSESVLARSSGIRAALTSNGTAGLTQDPFSIGSILFDTGLAGIGDLNLLINMLEQDNLASTLAEPNLTAISGEEAGFLAGGEFPVPAGRDQTGNLTIQYKKFGVSLNFKPIVMSEDRISLQMNTEVSSLNPSQGITLADVQVPGLDVRRATTTVEMNSGGSLMIAGLLRSDNTKGLNGIPGIKNTPVLGDLLSSKSFQRSETELVVIVTPYLVQPYADTTQAKSVQKSELDMMAPPPPPAGLMAPGKNGKPYLPPPIDQSMLDEGEPVLTPTKPVPAHTAVKLNTPLNKVFSKNMKQIYGDKIGPMPDKTQTYGYMMD